MQIHYYRKNVYGNPTLYIADQRQREWMRVLTGKITIDKDDMEALTALFKVEWVQVFEPEKVGR